MIDVLVLYRHALALLPRPFRSRFGAAMEADAEAILAAAPSARERRRRARLLAVDLARTALRERRLAPRTPNPQSRRGDLDMLSQDVRFALRSLRRHPGFAALVIATLGLGIGASATMFSVVDAVVLRPLPFPDADRLVYIWELTPQGNDFSTSQSNYLDFRERSRTVAPMAAYAVEPRTFLGESEPLRLTVTSTSRELFALLGVESSLGRFFNADEDTPGGSTRVAVLSAALWRSAFGADPGILGRSLALDGVPHTVVGVGADGFDFPERSDLWVPLAADPAYPRNDHRLGWIGRLRPEADLEDARRELEAIAADLSDRYPDSNGGWSVSLRTFPDWIVGPTLRRALAVLGGAVVALLLIAGSDVAGLFAVRATARRREIGVRSALGAGRAQLVRQLAVESLLLAALGAALGVWLARLGVSALHHLAPDGIPRLDTAILDARALAVTVGLALVAGLVFGLLPAVVAGRDGLADALRAGERGGSRSGRRLRDLLVATELGVATVLLVGAVLLLTSYRRLQTVDPGFRPEGALGVQVALTDGRFSPCGSPSAGPGCAENTGLHRRSIFVRQAIERLGALPGVAAAGATSNLPLSGNNTGQEITIEGREVAGPADVAFADWRVVAGDAFAALGLPLLRGRGFDAQEDLAGAPVAVVSETLAARYWPGEDPVGKRFALGLEAKDWLSVVGVARDLRDLGLETPPRSVIYLPYGYGPWPYVALVARATRPEGAPALASAVRGALRELDPALPLPEVLSLSQLLAGATVGPRFQLTVMGAFAALAVVLAATGVYGVVAFAVSRRRREIGLRVALGAEPSGVVGMVMAQALRPAALGIFAGLGVALLASRSLDALLFETPARDPATYVAVAALLVAVTVLASVVPARRAARVDPRSALGAE